MVFGLKKLQDELFCVTEERNYFQGKYLEQVSEIAALKEDLRKARREILKLRGELMETSSTSLLLGADEGSLHDSTYQTPRRRSSSRRTTTSLALPDGHQHQEEKKDAEGDDDEGNTSKNLPLQSADDGDEHNDDDEDDDEEEDSDADTEAADIRQSAEKLLQWASYRSYARSSATNSPDQGSVSSGQQAAAAAALEDSSTSLLGPMIPRTIESASLKNSMSEDSGGAPSPAAPAAVVPAAVATSSG